MKSIHYEDFLNLLPKAHVFGKSIRGICPFHEDSDPSLLVFKDGWFKCMGCWRYGTWATLYNKLKGQPVQVAPERKSSWGMPRVSGEDLETVVYQAHLDLEKFPSFGWYLDMRGIRGRVETNELGYYEGWYTIPVWTREHVFDTAVFRAAPHIQEVTNLRYWSPHKPTLFVPDWNLFDTSNYAIVVFGMFDALLLSELRFPVCTSTGGKDSFDPHWLDDVRKKIYIIPDKGEEAVVKKVNGQREFGTGTPYKLATALGWRGEVMMLEFPVGVKDPSGFAEKGKIDLLKKQLGEL